MGAPNLQIFREDTPTVEVGTELSPIDFGVCMSGEVKALPYDLLLYNDKTGVADAADARSIYLELLGLEIVDGWTSNGTAGQTATMVVLPIKAAEVRVDDILWTKVDSFTGYGSNLNIYTFDFTTGVIVFGDNIHGRIPDDGAVISIIYRPDLNTYGKTIIADSWVGYKSSGIVATSIDVDIEVGDLTDSTHVQIAHFPEIVSVTGVWDNAGKTGTNYFTGGTVNTSTGLITLGTELVGIPYVEYSYQIQDDSEGQFTPFIEGNRHLLTNPIPKQNAKKISLQATVPANADTEGGVNLRVILRVYYWY